MTRAVRLDDLRPDPANPKWHAIEPIEASIRRFGLGAPFVVDARTGLLSAGHGRRKALLSMRARGESPPSGVDGVGGEWTVPVSEWTSSSDAEAHAFLIASNRLTERGGWNAPTLAQILEELGPNRLGGVGFDQHDLDTVRAAAAAALTGAKASKPPREYECPACHRTFARST